MKEILEHDFFDENKKVLCRMVHGHMHVQLSAQ